jgi:Spy/CpxP family protein refolding chaperone
LIAAPEPDREAIGAKQEEVFAGQRRMQELVISHLLSQKKALTQEQQKRLFEMLRRQSGCAGHGPMMGRMDMGPVCPTEAPRE